MNGQCAKCKKEINGDKKHKGGRHHIYPRRHFGGAGPTIDLCQECHTAIEKLIPEEPKLKKERYTKIMIDFLRS